MTMQTAIRARLEQKQIAFHVKIARTKEKLEKLHADLEQTTRELATLDQVTDQRSTPA